MDIIKVSGLDKTFYSLCKKLEEYQFKMLSGLKQKNYSLTDDLSEIVGYILYVDNVPAGSIGLKKVSDQKCEIVRVFVEEGFRRKGYATILFEKIENLAKEMGFKQLEMIAWVRAESALRLYKKLNYIVREEKTSEWFGGYKYVEFFKNI